MGMALMGSGVSNGEERAIDAATKAVTSPLLENVSIRGATGILINVTGGPNMTLHEVNEASKLIQEEADEDANIIFGAVIDDTMDENIRVTVIATGFNKNVRLGKIPSKSVAQVTPIRPSAPAATKELPLAASAPVAEPATQVETVTDHVAESSKPLLHHERMERASLRELVSEIGLTDFQEDEYDIPTFLRKQAD